ncbi:protein kinase [Streptomyces sp. NPDC052236]|uniref:serine/threonine protein kinase n=1 Tax=Streptomyces sp. NPDC052236 TaxID=3365686 RepID=UPI0037D172C9
MVGGSQVDGEGRLLAGRYRTVEPLGRGGMGIVWRAVDETLGREVAVKELRAALADADGEGLAGLRLRMQREARAAARIRHPGVVAVHDVTEHEGRPVIVMELIEGSSLEDVVRRQGALDPRRAAEIGAKVLDALAAAHRAGVLHRDVKPGNILLEHGGRVVLTDFGIAAIEDPGDDADTHLTRSGELVGSLDYLAPERACGEQPGPPSDIWSLGATLYAAVESSTPFRRTSTWSTINAIVTEPLPEPRRAGPLTPALHALLAKDPASRPDAAEGMRILTAIAMDRPLPSSPDTLRLSRSNPSAPETPGTPGTPGTRGTPDRDPRPVPAGEFGPPPTDLNQDAVQVQEQSRAADTVERSTTGLPQSRRRRLPTIAASVVAVLLVGAGVTTYLTVGTEDDGKEPAAGSAVRTPSQGDDKAPSQQPPSSPTASQSGGTGGKGKKAGDQGEEVGDSAESPQPSPGNSVSAGATKAAPAPSASEATRTTYQVVNVKSGKCLSLDNGGSAANGTHAVQWTCNGGDEQRWYWAGASSNMLKNVKTGKCLSITGGGSTANGAQAIQSTCITDWVAPEQHWSHVAGGQFENGKSDRCLSIEGGGSTASGAQAIQSTCITDWVAPEQQWKLTR